MDRSTGDSISNYEFLGKNLGGGAYAIVRLARDRRTSKLVAIKTFDKIKIVSENVRKSIQNEIKILSGLDHLNTTKLLGSIENTRNIHIVMRYGGKNNLKTSLKNIKKFENLKKIGKQIAEGIKYLHDNNITHRDLKLDNITINKALEVTIVDFGFSAKLKNEKKETLICGTPQYMAPELL